MKEGAQEGRGAGNPRLWGRATAAARRPWSGRPWAPSLDPTETGGGRRGEPGSSGRRWFGRHFRLRIRRSRARGAELMRRSRSAGAAGAPDERRMCGGGAPAVRRRCAAWSPEMRRICGQWAAVSGWMRWRKRDRADATRGMMLLRQSLDVRVEFLRILVGAYSSWAERTAARAERGSRRRARLEQHREQSGAICSRGCSGASRPAAQVLARGLEQEAGATGKHGGAERRALPRKQTGLAGCSPAARAGSWSRKQRGGTTRGARRVLRCRQQRCSRAWRVLQHRGGTSTE
jgi:hypothetical protein